MTYDESVLGFKYCTTLLYCQRVCAVLLTRLSTMCLGTQKDGVVQNGDICLRGLNKKNVIKGAVVLCASSIIDIISDIK